MSSLSSSVLRLSAIVVALCGPGAGRASCGDPLVEVAAPQETVAQTCAAVTAAKTLLEECGLTQTEPILVSAVEQAIHPSFGACLATYTSQTACLQVTRPDRLSAIMEPDDARRALPADVLYAELIVHEMAHALIHQTAGKVDIGPGEHEFIANALAMESLPDQWRDVLLAARPIAPPGKVDLVHPMIYALDSRAFANNAWVLFRAEGNGCALVQKILSGNYRFPAH